MKKYRVRKGSVADKVVTALNKIDEEPYCYIAFVVMMVIFYGVMILTINSEYPPAR